jgi:type I restriction enzyme, R subunit
LSCVQVGKGHATEARDDVGFEVRDHLAASLSIELRELLDPPFSQRGGHGRARELFGQDLDTLLTELTDAIAS